MLHSLSSRTEKLKIAVLIPCYNEAITVGKVVRDFRAHLPTADVYVYDNNSSDDTAAVARDAGAFVRHEKRQGKGYVVRRMFADIDADIYLMVDGDATYDASAAPQMIEILLSGPFDYVNGVRVSRSTEAYRFGHEFGNKLFTRLATKLFGASSSDMLSGYKALSRRFVRSFPASSMGFEIETEILVHALDIDVPISEIQTDYFDRPEGSVSKLSTFHDGFRILMLIFYLIRDKKPLTFFSILSALFLLSGVGAGVPVITEYFETGLVPRLPTAVLSVGLVLVASISFFSGLILDGVAEARYEQRLLRYLSLEPPMRPLDD